MEKSLVVKIQWFADKLYLKKSALEDDLLLRSHFHSFEDNLMGKIEAYEDMISLMHDVFEKVIIMDYQE